MNKFIRIRLKGTLRRIYRSVKNLEQLNPSKRSPFFQSAASTICKDYEAESTLAVHDLQQLASLYLRTKHVTRSKLVPAIQNKITYSAYSTCCACDYDPYVTMFSHTFDFFAIRHVRAEAYKVSFVQQHVFLQKILDKCKATCKATCLT